MTTRSFLPSWPARIFLGALLVRLVVIFFWEKFHLDRLVTYDNYLTTARYWLGETTGIRDIDKMAQAPVFVGLCALCLKFAGGYALLAIRLVNALAGAATCAIGFAWARKHADERVALGTGLLMAFSPVLVYFTPHAQAESVYLFFQMLFFLVLAHYRLGAFGLAVLLGIIGETATLARPVFILFVPFAVAAFAVAYRPSRRAFLIFVAGLGLGWALPLTGWKAVQRAQHGVNVPVHPAAGQVLFMGMAASPRDRELRAKEVGEAHARPELAGVAALDNYFKDRVLTFMRDHPAQYAGIIVRKFFRYWRPLPYPPFPLPARIALGLFYTTVFAFALVGAWALRRRARELAPAYALVLCLSGIHSVLDTSLRYRLPLEPFICFFAAAGVAAVSKRIRS